MRKLYLVVAATAIGLVLAPSAAQAQEPFEASFKGKQKRNDPPCVAGLLCGTGTIAGYGEASFSLVPTSIGPTVGSCQPVTALTTLALADGSGTLTLDATGELCSPGNSANAPGAVRSFGNPFEALVTYEVVGGTGVFAGASGDGTAKLTSAGARQHLKASGVLDF